MTTASFHADGTAPSLKLLLNKSHMLTDIPLAHNVSSFGGRPSRPGALPGFRLDSVSKTSVGYPKEEGSKNKYKWKNFRKASVLAETRTYGTDSPSR